MQRRARQRIRAEARQDALEVSPVQRVELRERQAPRPDLLHRGLVLAAPGVGEGLPVAAPAERSEDALRLARDAAAPIDQRAEHVEEESLDLALHALKLRRHAKRDRSVSIEDGKPLRRIDPGFA